MAEVKWIKIVTDIFDDEKILIIESMPEADSMIVIWFKLLCLAGKQNNSGVFTINNRIAYTDEMFSAIFRRPINTVRLALKTFETLGMVEIVNGTVTIPNWGKHQNLEKIAARNEYMRNYMQEYRERQKQLISGNSAVNDDVNANVSTNNANSERHVSSLEEERDLEKERDLDREKEDDCAEPPDSGRSTPPSDPQPTPSEFDIPLNDGTAYNVPQENIEVYKRLYPAVDVEQALRNMIGWCMGNENLRKTRRGVKRFITNWLAKDQDDATKKGGRNGANRRSDAESPRRVFAGETIL